MFFRIKSSGPHRYVQIVENFREAGRVRQRVVCTLGRQEELAERGGLEALLSSGARRAVTFRRNTHRYQRAGRLRRRHALQASLPVGEPPRSQPVLAAVNRLVTMANKNAPPVGNKIDPPMIVR